ncbi:hypothetical protein Goari_009884, partial [Gossypium aridum]|nr:hypothetical protein [Gossypium aridum]
MFWVDIWCGNSPLKLEFPRLFRLAKLKNGMVIDYSNNSGFSKVKWEDIFIRPLLDRELGILSRLTERVKSVVLVPDLEDSLNWTHDNKGEFSVKKLTNLLIEGEGDEINFAFDKIWKLKVPPRVRNFLRMLAIDSVPTKDFLVKKGVHLQNIMNVCPWCDREQERVNHLFFKCNFIVGFWRRIFNWWEVGWKMVSGNFEEFYSLCFNVKLHSTRKSLWLIAIAAACWSVWLARNEMVFERKVLSMDTLIFHSKMRALLWVRVAFD